MNRNLLSLMQAIDDLKKVRDEQDKLIEDLTITVRYRVLKAMEQQLVGKTVIRNGYSRPETELVDGVLLDSYEAVVARIRFQEGVIYVNLVPNQQHRHSLQDEFVPIIPGLLDEKYYNACARNMFGGRTLTSRIVKYYTVSIPEGTLQVDFNTQAG